MLYNASKVFELGVQNINRIGRGCDVVVPGPSIQIFSAVLHHAQYTKILRKLIYKFRLYKIMFCFEFLKIGFAISCGGSM